MNAIVIEHVKVSELPEAWRAKLSDADARVTVRIEAEVATIDDADADAAVTDDPAFGIWRDRTDMSDVADYLSKLRAPRYSRD